MIAIDDYSMVKVTWYDAVSSDEWMEVSELSQEPAKIVTLGFLIKETDTTIHVAQNIDMQNGNISMIMTIPLHWIEELEHLDQ